MICGKLTKCQAFLLSAILITAAPIPMAQAQSAPDAAASERAVKAGVITLERQTVPITNTLTGQASAYQSAAVRPLVDGIVTETSYQAGRPVTKGAALFKIDPVSYQAKLDAANASLQSAEAAVPAAKAAVDRAQKLLGTGSTQQVLDAAIATYQQDLAAVAVAQASVTAAQIDLDRTTITSPIDGIPSVAAISVGDLVTAGQSDTLATVTKLDPIYVDLSEASQRMLQLRARVEEGKMKLGDRIDTKLILQNGQTFAGQGRLDSVGATVSTSTGTVNVRFEFDNPTQLIMPGMYLRAELTFGTSDAFLVPQLAATQQPDGTLKLFVLGDDGKSKEIYVTSEGSTDRAWIVPDGIEPGTKLIVDNLRDMIAGQKIEPIPATISDSGIVETEVAASATPAANTGAAN